MHFPLGQKTAEFMVSVNSYLYINSYRVVEIYIYIHMSNECKDKPKPKTLISALLS